MHSPAVGREIVCLLYCDGGSSLLRLAVTNKNEKNTSQKYRLTTWKSENRGNKVVEKGKLLEVLSAGSDRGLVC